MNDYTNDTGKFKSGNPGRPVGSKDKKTEQWKALAESITTEHAERFNEIMHTLPPEKFCEYYIKVLEYFKPRLSRVNSTTEANEVTIRYINKRAHDLKSQGNFSEILKENRNDIEEFLSADLTPQQREVAVNELIELHEMLKKFL